MSRRSCACLRELTDHAPQQNPGEMFLERAAALHVVGRIEIIVEGRDGRVEPAVINVAGERDLRLGGTPWSRPGAKEGETHVRKAISFRTGGCGQAEQGVIAMATRKLGKAVTHLRRRGRNPNGGQHIAWRKRGLEQALE